jgi:CRP-like cAMP-binding protein
VDSANLTITQKPEILASSILFKDLDQKSLNSVIKSAHSRKVENDSFFFMEGDQAVSVFVLMQGKVKLTQVTPDGQQVILGYTVPGREFGVIAALVDVTYPVSAQAVGGCHALAWDHETINQLMVRFPVIALNALRILAERIGGLQRRIRELATQRVERRIARTLLRLANQTGKMVANGVLIDLPISRQDLAEMNGTTLYTVSRTLKKWETQEIISSKREQITILYPHGLVSIAEDLQMSHTVSPIKVE